MSSYNDRVEGVLLAAAAGDALPRAGPNSYGAPGMRVRQTAEPAIVVGLSA